MEQLNFGVTKPSSILNEQSPSSKLPSPKQQDH
jgi:hypothetical protein